MSGKRLSLAAALLALAFLAPLPLPAQDEGAAVADRTLALQLYRELRHLEALPLVEKVIAAHPDDMILQEALGACLLAKSVTLSDAEERRALRVRARQALKRSRELGNDSTLVHTLLEALPEDGREATFSAREEVEAAMREGEAAFAKRDFDAAQQAYGRALALDPTHYEATLFIGDIFFVRGDLEQAVEWFAVAAQKDPDRETAYRYWGDALVRQGKMDEARRQFIEAVVCEPYRRSSWGGLQQWAQEAGVRLGHPRIESPNQMEQKDDKTLNITIDASSLEKKDGTSSWLVYEITRAAWKTAEGFAKEFPDEPAYRHTLREEADALRGVVASVRQSLKVGEIEKLDPALATLVELDDKELLEAYILFARADEGIAQDYFAYRREHREALRRYLDEYVVPRGWSKPKS